MTILQMRPGKSYVLQNMARNKLDKCLAVSPYGYQASEAYLVKCGMYGYPIGQRRYVDGSVFMCLNEVKDKWDRTLYRVLTPDGKAVHLFASGNKTKFRELK